MVSVHGTRSVFMVHMVSVHGPRGQCSWSTGQCSWYTVSVHGPHGQCSWSTWSVFMVHWSVFMVHGQCSWSTWSVFMVHVVSVHGPLVSVNIIQIIYNAMNADSARIRPFYRSLFGLSPMNADMSVFCAYMA